MSYSTKHEKKATNLQDSLSPHSEEEEEVLPLLNHRKSLRYYIPDKKYLVPFPVPSNYDFSLSSEQNYHQPEAPFVGKYREERSQLDYSFHLRYSEERQLFHDQLIDMFHKTVVYDKKNQWYCESPLENWIVFTAGVMGAGKGHTVDWLDQQQLFPKEAFVNVDPDAIRFLLPEFEMYNKVDCGQTGYLTQKEVGYISEVLSYHALERGKNVLVDGSLRDAPWYLEYFRNLRQAFPKLKLAILHIDAPFEAVVERCNNRAKVTGRLVPREVIRATIEAIPKSLEILRPKVEFFASIMNDNNRDKFLQFAEMKRRLRRTCEAEARPGFALAPSDTNGHHQTTTNRAIGDSNREGEAANRKDSTNNSPNYTTTILSSDHNNSDSNSNRAGPVDRKRSRPHRYSCSSSNNNSTNSNEEEEEGFELLWTLSPVNADDPHSQYLFLDQEHDDKRLMDGWTMIFSDVWTMTCEIPLPWPPSNADAHAAVNEEEEV